MKRRLLPVILALFLSLLISAFPVLAASGTLPGGTSIEVNNTSPENGAVVYIPAGETSIDILDEGTASVGEGVAIADTTLIYVIDASGSTGSPSGGTTCGEQQDSDPESGPDEIIDCEILATKNLNDTAVSFGSVDEVAIIMFAGSSVTADATPAGGDDPIIPPDADADINGVSDLYEVARSIKVAVLVGEESGFARFSDKPMADIYGTNFGAGIQAALDVAAMASNPNVIVVFMSDGLNNKGAHVNTFSYGSVKFYTFAIGAGSSCTSDPNGLGSLKDIADLSGGTCTRVEDPSQLPDILPELIGSNLISLEIEVDGQGAVPIDNAGIDPDLPQPGPVTVNYSTMLYGLGPGEHEICVTAYGSDAGGSGSLLEYKTITVAQGVNIDIKPGSYPNSINLKKQGVVPVAILGSDSFDVSLIDPSSLRFGPNETPAVHWALEDVNSDGFIDMISQYEQTETGIQPGDESACVSGTYDGGLPFTGCDSIRTIH